MSSPSIFPSCFVDDGGATGRVHRGFTNLRIARSKSVSLFKKEKGATSPGLQRFCSRQSLLILGKGMMRQDCAEGLRLGFNGMV